MEKPNDTFIDLLAQLALAALPRDLNEFVAAHAAPDSGVTLTAAGFWTNCLNNSGSANCLRTKRNG